jgi:GT2 family glycosyltransferase
MPPTVSIIVPTYNRERLLRETLAQLLDQDYPRFDLLMIDQTAAHEAETESFLSGFVSRIRRFQLQQANLPAARNFGIRQSSGEIVVFFDDDMIVPKDAVSKLVETYNDSRVWGATGFTLGSAEKDEDKYRAYDRFVRRRADFARLARVRIDSFNGCLMSFRRSLFDRVGFFDEWLGTQVMAAGEDAEFCRRATLATRGLYLNPALTTRHLEGQDGGCERRTRDPDQVRLHQLQVYTYVVMKNPRHRGTFGRFHAEIECYRTSLFNRGLLDRGIAGFRRRYAEVRRAVRQSKNVLSPRPGAEKMSAATEQGAARVSQRR